MSSIEDRLYLIEERLARLEYIVDRTNQVASQPASMPSHPKSYAESAATTKASSHSGNWLGITGIICFILAAGFIIKLSIESGWLTPFRQIIIAALFGISLITVGLKYIKLDREYASLLPAAGIVVLYLTSFSAYTMYYLISFESAVFLSGVISLFCIYLFSIIKNNLYPIIAVIGAYLAPAVLDFYFSHPISAINIYWPLYYYLICSFTFSVISIWMSTRLLTIVSSYFAILFTAAQGRGLHANHYIAGLLAIHFLIFALATYAYGWLKEKPLTESESWEFFRILLLFYATEYFFLYEPGNNMVAWFSLAFAALLIALYLLTRQIFVKENFVSRSMLYSFAAIVVFHSGFLVLMPESAGPWVFVAILLSKALFGGRANSVPLPVRLMVLLVLILEYGYIANQLLFPPMTSSWLVVFLAAASIWVLFIFDNKRMSNDYGYLVLSSAHFIVLLALYRLTDDIGSLAVSSVWLTYAVLILIAGFIRRDAIMANSALLVLGFSAGKVLLYDASSAPTTVRILCLLVTGTVLYIAGFLYRKIAAWPRG